MRSRSFVFFLLFSAPLMAEMNDSTLLKEAEILINNAPETSLELANNYLKKQTLSDLTQITLGNTDRNASITPIINTVQAYFISARANCSLENHDQSWEALEKARFLIEEYSLANNILELQLIEAMLYFYLENNKEKAKKSLNSLLLNLPPQDKKRSEKLDKLAFESRLLNAIIQSHRLSQDEAIALFDEAHSEMGEKPNILQKIYYQIALGNYYLHIQLHEKALSELLSAYWLASENNFSSQIARANISLTKLFQQQNIFDEAIQHAIQAAEYFERHTMSRALSKTQVLMGDIYHQQERFNFSLVHYFNAMDIENTFIKKHNMSTVLISIAKTYFRMNQISRAEKYLKEGKELAIANNKKESLANAFLLEGEIYFHKQKIVDATTALEQSVKLAIDNQFHSILVKTLPLLSRTYEQQKKYKLAIETQHYFEQFNVNNNHYKKSREQESFRHSQQAIERQLLLKDMQRQHKEDTETIVEQKQINLFLIATICVLVIVFLARNETARRRFKELRIMRKEIYSHPRSGLRSLHMLNDKLAGTLAQTSADFEQWYLNEMIHQPLSDKLRFAMFEIPILKVLYLQQGYKQGLKIEEELGDFFKEYIQDPARLYHFSDSIFIYVEPNSNSNSAPEWLARKIQSLVDNFIYQTTLRSIDSKIHLGMADIPFLPRAVTRIGNSELIEILLMATNAARQAAQKEGDSQWVHLSPIDSTPAAYFAKTQVREACLKGINSGFIKVKTSAIQGINWQTLHGYSNNTTNISDKETNKAI